MLRRRFNSLLTFAALCIITGALLLGWSWLSDVTAPGPQPHALWRATLPGVDVGLDTSPAAIGRAGYIELWYYPHDADDIQPVFQLFGAPALPAMHTPNEQPLLPVQPTFNPQLRWT
jgi:hypothetical protein